MIVTLFLYRNLTGKGLKYIKETLLHWEGNSPLLCKDEKTLTLPLFHSQALMVYGCSQEEFVGASEAVVLSKCVEWNSTS
jgi:hypothetical protein